ncbi:MAG: hypothetical protein IJ825_10445 [Oscillospiraceae bacterium]|nr:hypothetical protein [Oscillospiraceae bacterium]
MKTKIRDLIRKLLGSRKRAAVFSAVCVILLALLIALLMRLAAPGNESDVPTDSKASSAAEEEFIREASYFEDSAYPAQFSIDGSGILAVLDGSATPSLKWEVSCAQEEIVTVEADGGETEGKFMFRIRPQVPGYADLTCVRSMEIGGQAFPAVTIHVSVVVSENSHNALETTLTEVRQELNETGASDTDYPYLLAGDRILFPNGGDWTADPEPDAGDYYLLVSGTEGTVGFVRVMTQPALLMEMDEETLSRTLGAGILLKSASLGRSERIGVEYDDNGQLHLVRAEET